MHQKDQKVIYMQSSVAAAAWLVVVRKKNTFVVCRAKRLSCYN